MKIVKLDVQTVDFLLPESLYEFLENFDFLDAFLKAVATRYSRFQTLPCFLFKSDVWISSSFKWDETEQGREYWFAVERFWQYYLQTL